MISEIKAHKDRLLYVNIQKATYFFITLALMSHFDLFIQGAGEKNFVSITTVADFSCEGDSFLNSTDVTLIQRNIYD